MFTFVTECLELYYTRKLLSVAHNRIDCIFIKAEFLLMQNLQVKDVENLRKEKIKHFREGQRVLELEPCLVFLTICRSGMNLNKKEGILYKEALSQGNKMVESGRTSLYISKHNLRHLHYLYEG